MISRDFCILDALPDGVWISGSNGVTIFYNKAYKNFMDFNSDELVGVHINEAVAKGYLSKTVTQDVLRLKQRVSKINITKTGISLLVTGTPVYDKYGDIKYVVVTGRDVTEIVKMREELNKHNEILEKYQAELLYIRSKHINDKDIVAQSKIMKDILNTSLKIAETDSPVLIIGESGVGKEVIASFIHKNSPRSSGPFISVNCGAVPETLIESELYGYEKGSFTNANRKGKPGMFELANDGTIFLDEIGEIPIQDQAKLLQILEKQEIRRIGGTKSIRINARIIAATNRDLKKMVISGSFRADLFYRLNVLPVFIPSLRERKDDIQPLILFYIKILNEKHRKGARFSPDAIRAMCCYHWPGNVRELRNAIERLIVLSDGYISLQHLPEEIINKKQEGDPININKALSFREAISEMERTILEEALNYHGTTRKAAKALKLSQPTFVRKINKYRRYTNY